MREPFEIYRDILQFSLLTLREIAYTDNRSRIIAEAEHVHNLPMKIFSKVRESHEHYLRVNVAVFLKKLSEMDKLDGDECYLNNLRRYWSELQEVIDRMPTNVE